MTQLPEDASGTVDLSDAYAVLTVWLDGDVDALASILSHADPGALVGQLIIMVVQFGRVLTDGDDRELRALIGDAITRPVEGDAGPE